MSRNSENVYTAIKQKKLTYAKVRHCIRKWVIKRNKGVPLGHLVLNKFSICLKNACKSCIDML